METNSWSKWLHLNINCSSLEISRGASSNSLYIIERSAKEAKISVFLLKFPEGHLRRMYVSSSEKLVLCTVFEQNLLRLYCNAKYSKNSQPSHYHSKSDLEPDLIIKANSLDPKKGMSATDIVPVYFKTLKSVQSGTQLLTFPKGGGSSQHHHFDVISTPVNEDFQNEEGNRLLDLIYQSRKKGRVIRLNGVGLKPEKMSFRSSVFDSRWKGFEIKFHRRVPRLLAIDEFSMQRKVWSFSPRFQNLFAGFAFHLKGL